MTTPALTPRAPDPALSGVIKLAILAVGGQGGGVLAGWIEEAARAQGWFVQATSVAGVAQRTGATIYYIEMAPPSPAGAPVFSLAPSWGDVDIMIAAELMEAGRAVMRGFVTPERTTLIASTHRALAVSEKTVPGDGTASSSEVIAALEAAAKRLIMADFDALAVKNGSVISASLLGALAETRALPFAPEAFRKAVQGLGKGVEASLKAFDAGAAAARDGRPAPSSQNAAPKLPDPVGPPELIARWRTLETRAAALPGEAAEMARHGLRKTAEFQDLDYAEAYLKRLEEIAAGDDPARGHVFTREAAKYLATAMAYDDVIRVADLKTRPARFRRIKAEMGADDARLMSLTEFFHPRAEELVSLLPAATGRRIAANPRAMRWIDRLFGHGRRIRSTGAVGFGMLWMAGALRPSRLKSLRHATESAHLEVWLARALSDKARDYDLGVEILRCRRLIKGYSDTHARGLSKFDRVLEGAALVASRPDAADWTRRLREAALKDEKGDALEAALKTIRSFV